MLDTMIFVANNLANGDHMAYPRPKFESEPYAVTAIYLLFASSGTSRVAALASVATLQWVEPYGREQTIINIFRTTRLLGVGVHSFAVRFHAVV
jgi:hypothetical protein